MEVLKEILDWSESRPLWQRDALRRLIQKPIINEDDYNDLLQICKAQYGLADAHPVEVLILDHLPISTSQVDAVSLDSLNHLQGVNAMAKGQTLKFGKNLTVVFGKNAAGKSGFTRILKKACRARGAEDIMPNVMVDGIPDPPTVVLNYSIGETSHSWTWRNNEQKIELSNVCVFDRHCAAVYLDDKTDVAFRPFGLDLFDKLSVCCEKLKVLLQKEIAELNRTRFEINIPPFTMASRQVQNLTALTNLSELNRLATISAEEEKTLFELRRKIADLKAEDPEKVKKIISLKLERHSSFRKKLGRFIQLCSKSTFDHILNTQNEISDKTNLVNQLNDALVNYKRLPETGSLAWMKMWHAGEEFSKEVFLTKVFPVISDNAICVFCQQDIDKHASDRLNAFGEFVNSSAQGELNQAKSKLDNIVKGLGDLLSYDLSNSDIIDEVRIDDATLADTLISEIKSVEQEIRDLTEAILNGSSIKESMIRNIESYNGLASIEESLAKRLDTLSSATARNSLANDEATLREYEGRIALFNSLDMITREVERKKKIAVYAQCIEEVSTAAITRKSTELTKITVTETLAKAFQKEIEKLGFKDLEIELQASGGSRGAMFHRLNIRRAPSIKLQTILSEGEARALSIAAFFSELSTSTNASAILFDDPVSSLDHLWRDKVAARLVEESKTRQTIIFTHDIVFLNSLRSIADETNISCLDQYIVKGNKGAGTVLTQLPWVAMRIADRIGALKEMYQLAEKLSRTSTEDYEQKAIVFYGYLREAWERGLEEILLNGIVERYRPSIQTLRVTPLSDITPEDCATLQQGMTKCSKWLPGHDNAPAENSAVPGPAELLQDLNTLDIWVKSIKKRREKKS